MNKETMKDRIAKALESGEFLDMTALAAVTGEEPKSLRRYLRLFIADGTVQKRGPRRGPGVRYGLPVKENEYVPVP